MITPDYVAWGILSAMAAALFILLGLLAHDEWLDHKERKRSRRQ